MKVLYISPADDVDYLDDGAFIGLREMFGDDLVDCNKRYHSYDTCDSDYLKTLWGQGMTVSHIFPDIEIDRTDISAKIRNRYFDLVIYGSIWRCEDYIDEVLKYYPKNKIAFLDGEDIGDESLQYHRPKNTKYNGEIFCNGRVYLHDMYKSGCPYFKRELEHLPFKTILPITYAFPSGKVDLQFNKTQDFAFCDPRDKSTYIYETEESYYAGYKTSRFGITMKKSGWDCMRHYEIMANGCIPYFIDLDECPQLTMMDFPKEICLNVMKDFKNGVDPSAIYNKYANPLFYYFTQHNTTENLAKYILAEMKL